MGWKVMLVAGARPNFMKVAPLLRTLRADRRFDARLIHTGQHYDANLSGAFFRDLDIPPPDYSLVVGSGSHAVQTGEILKRIEPVLEAEKPRAVIVVGDVNSTLAAALGAAKLGIMVVHAEAGLRSFDRTMPEEINRLATDAISDVLLASEPSGVRHLLAEGVRAERIHLVGNLMIDSLLANLERARRLPVPEGRYGVVTLHRAANVDNPAMLGELLGALGEIARELPLYWPVHPRTRQRMAQAKLAVPMGLRLEEPLGYLEFLARMAAARVVLTDSGGVQEETTVLGVPCLTLRENTERPVTVEMGTNRIAGCRRETILAAWRDARSGSEEGPRTPPLWDGRAAERARDVLAAVLSGEKRNGLAPVLAHGAASASAADLWALSAAVGETTAGPGAGTPQGDGTVGGADPPGEPGPRGGGVPVPEPDAAGVVME
jgi:UDP-N-acetylglucosamine 2-epimerase (non-hydrolysing)